MRRKWIPFLRIYLGSTDCALGGKDYRLDRRGNGFDGRENGSNCGLHLLFVEEDLLRVKEDLLRVEDAVFLVERPWTENCQSFTHRNLRLLKRSSTNPKLVFWGARSNHY